MMKPKRTIATRYRKEEELAKTHSNALQPHNSVSTRHNTNKIKNREVPDVTKDVTLVYKTVATNLLSEKINYQKELSELRKNNDSLTSSLELKENLIGELKLSIQDLERYCIEFKKKNTKMTKLSITNLKQIKNLRKEKEMLIKKISSLERSIEKSKVQEENNEKSLQQLRESCKQVFNSQIYQNFAQTNSSLIKAIVNVYESNSRGEEIQHCPAVQYINSVPPWVVEESSSNNGRPAKKRRMDNSNKNIDKNYSQKALEALVMNLEPRHSEQYQLWRNVLWSLNKYGSEQRYNTLEIAVCFSKRSTKYKNFQDVKKTFDSSDGTLSLSYLIEISKIFEEDLDTMTEYLSSILPPKYVPLTINQVDISDSQKFQIHVNSTVKSHTLFIIPDLCVVVNEDYERLSFLAKQITSKNSELASLCPEMARGFIVTLKKKYYEFKARNKPKVSMILHDPLKPADSFITLPNGKQDNKESHLTKIRKALREEAIKLLARTGKHFRDDDDDSNMVIIPDKDPDTFRSDVELIEDLFDADPIMMNRYCFTGKTVYHCKSDTNLWCEISYKAFDWHLQRNLKSALQLSKAELRYIGMSNAIVKLRNVTLGKIENLDFTELLDSNLHLFITKNKTIVTSSIPPIIRNIEIDDLAEKTCGWSYSYELSMKYMVSVESYFDKLIPQRCERDWFLSYIAKMLSGQRIHEYFLVLADKCGNGNGISTLMSLLATVFGNYYIANTKMVVSGGIRENNQYDGGIYNLRGKRLLFADKLQKSDTLNGAFIKCITGQSNYYIQDKMKVCRTHLKFPVQAGLIMTFTEDNAPKFDKNDQDFVKRMVAFPMRSQFLCRQEYDRLIQMWDQNTDIQIADDTLKLQFPEWRSALLDLLIKYYDESLPIPESMMDLKKKLCDENFDYYDWMDLHVHRDDDIHAFVSATHIMSIIKKSPNFSPYEMKRLKFAMSSWAKKNEFSYKPRHVHMDGKRKRVETKSVIMSARIECR